ncbi:hypothetical protein PTT_13707 [Pyrenophora teres f. teres 0-1]|uniref:Uncharacterized protein n=1 Tax=Pyrenophora teres f. teres (strain 0-1) TaxID=861557 RepID=E3RWM6_PYRTT|nr:hypothetical protein PTT_13707 [Pyrenophora teres f. teres 0-1]
MLLFLPYRFRRWESLNYKVTVSKKSKEEEAIAHADYILLRSGDNFTAIYLDASQHDKGIGISMLLTSLQR